MDKYQEVITGLQANLAALQESGKDLGHAQPLILFAILEAICMIGSDLVEYNSKKYIVGV